MARKRRPPATWLPVRTARLLLREFRESDLDDVHAYGSDAEVTRFMLWGPNTPEDSRAFLARTFEAQKASPRASFNAAVELVAEQRVIGAVEVRIANPDNRTAEIGYTFGRLYWGQGLGPEAAEAMLAHAFQTLRMHRVIATCDVRNTKSWRVMEKLGMRREALFRKDALVRGHWRDSYLYALLANEWRDGEMGAQDWS
jgi:RimJ/RimL family protein N-acetyltransferase